MLGILAQATGEATLTNAAVQAGAVGVLLLAAVVYFVRRDAKQEKKNEDRELREIARITQDIATRQENTAALQEVRRQAERTSEVLEQVLDALEERSK